MTTLRRRHTDVSQRRATRDDANQNLHSMLYLVNGDIVTNDSNQKLTKQAATDDKLS